MHRYRVISITLLVLLLLAAHAASAEKTIQFSWAVLMDTATGMQALDFSSPPSLKTGTTLQIYLEQNPGTYLYIYHIGSTGELSCIFPDDPRSYEKSPPSEASIRIPPDSARFELMPPGGQEKLYLLASPDRLLALEKKTSAFLEHPDDKELQAAVIRELKILRRTHSSLAQKTETSVPVAGTIRSRGGTDSLRAVSVTTEGFYSRILRINHE
ncbi:MAG: hypothetical protein Kow0089_06070 [Desulfobulbaceae bacterium]